MHITIHSYNVPHYPSKFVSYILHLHFLFFSVIPSNPFFYQMTFFFGIVPTYINIARGCESLSNTFMSEPPMTLLVSSEFSLILSVGTIQFDDKFCVSYILSVSAIY